MTQQEFQEKLTTLRAEAEGQGHSVEKKRIEEVFAGDELNPEQLKLVYDYFLAAGIRVEGYIKAGEVQQGDRLPEKQKQRLQEYQEQLGALPGALPGERERCLTGLLSGEREERERLIELFMPEVVPLARQAYRKGTAIGDLIQEGNLSLILALDRLAGGLRIDPKDAEAWVRQEIRQGIQTFVEEHTEQKQKDRKLVTKAQDFRDGVEILKEEMGRKVYLDEVADFLNLSEEEVTDLLKLTGDQIKEEEL